MFDFEKLIVYKKSRDYNKKVNQFLENTELNRTIIDQLGRASFSIMLNIAEGTGRYTNKDKRNFYVISRGSAFECVAVFDFLRDIGKLSEDEYVTFYNDLEELSKMLFSMIRNLS